MIIIRGKKHLKAKFYENLRIGCSEEDQKTVRKKTMETHPYLKEKKYYTSQFLKNKAIVCVILLYDM